MGIYYLAVDWMDKKIMRPPEGFSCKKPEIYHPENPFPHMVVMKNIQGSNFEIVNDVGCEYETSCGFKDVTNDVYNEYLEVWNEESI